MPREERFLSFDVGEILEAVNMGASRENHPVPPAGTVTHMESAIHGERTRIMLQIAENEYNKNRIAYPLDFFIYSLVLYCQSVSIPIPKAGTKTLKVFPDKIIMKIEI